MAESDDSTGSLCTGYAGLDMAVRLAGAQVDEAWFSEVDPGPSQVLAERYSDVKNLHDMTMVDWRSVDPVRRLTAGFPCQGASAAGRRLGRADRRWLWPEVARCMGELPEQPEEMFAENVANLLRIDDGEAFADILADLHALGYNVRWVVVGACNAGLSHHRHRVFILATLARKRRKVRGRTAVAELVPILADWWTPDGQRYGRRWPAAGSMIDGRVYADEAVRCACPPTVRLLPTPRAGDYKRGAETLTDGRTARGHGGTLNDVARLLPTPRATDGANGGPNQRGSKGDLALPAAVIGERFAEYAAAVMRHVETTSVMPPEPTEPNRNGAARLAPAFPEWMMTLPAGWVTDVLDRVPALKAIGNGVAPLQGALAYRLLAGRAAA